MQTEAENFYVISKTHPEMTGFYKTVEMISEKLFSITKHSAVNEHAVYKFFQKKNIETGEFKINSNAFYLYMLGDIEMTIYQAFK